MTNDQKKVLIGVAWPYVNGDLHIGHLAGYLLPADIYARYMKLLGHEVVMVSGSDCHGTPITVEAEKKGVKPQDIVNEYHAKDVELFLDILDLQFTNYTTTTTENHKKVVQDFFIALLEKGYITIQTSMQFYSEEEKRFLPDRYVEGTCGNCGYEGARSDQCDNCGKLLEQDELKNPYSKLTKSPVTLKETEHYYIDWPKMQQWLEEYVEGASGAWKKWVASETKGWLETGLQPRAITRDLDWGIELPIDRIPEVKRIENSDGKRLYVWFEAVIGYLSATIEWAEKEGKNWKDYWYGDNLHHVYFLGKDNLPFHTMFWPGQLHGYDETLHVPDVVSVNMFLNLEGKQFSKSRGVSIPIKDIVEEYGNDPVRFYIASIMPETSDSSFAWDDFKRTHNEKLIATFSNYISRVANLCRGMQGSDLQNVDQDENVVKHVSDALEKACSAMDAIEIKRYVEAMMELAQHANKYISDNEVWVVKKENPEEFKKYAWHMMYYAVALGWLSHILMPETSEKIMKIFGLTAVSSHERASLEESLQNLVSKASITDEKHPHLFELL